MKHLYRLRPMSLLSQSRKVWWKGTYQGTILRLPQGEAVCDDALHFLNCLKDECADIVFLDPPFNLGKPYGASSKKDDLLNEDQYFKYMTSVLWRCAAVLKKGGALYLYHIPRWAVRLSNVLEQDLQFRHWIAVAVKNGFARGQYLHPAHYALLYYTKGDPAHFNRPRIAIAKCRKCGESIKDYGGYKKYVQEGLNLSDVWEDVSPVRHPKFKHRLSNEIPMKIPARAVEISGFKGGLLIDPFAGSGTSLVAAKAKGMHCVACDREKVMLGIMEKRLSSFQNGLKKGV
jgi:site-specific DNA-methyltransferase (adenine-specific)